MIAGVQNDSGPTPEERLCQILNAVNCGGEVERQRLADAGKPLSLALPGLAPFAHAFYERALLVYIELLEMVMVGLDILACEDDDVAAGAAPAGGTTIEPMECNAEEDLPWHQTPFSLALAACFVLKTKANGWKLFCERWNVPPFLVWEGLPSFHRLQRALLATEEFAFDSESMLRWLNAGRSAGQPELALPLIVEGEAAKNEAVFRQRAEWMNV